MSYFFRNCCYTFLIICYLNQGFTHFFESTFESVEAIAEYVAHPAHVEYAKLLVPCLEKVLAFDYKPTIVNL